MTFSKNAQVSCPNSFKVKRYDKKCTLPYIVIFITGPQTEVETFETQEHKCSESGNFF